MRCNAVISACPHVLQEASESFRQFTFHPKCVLCVDVLLVDAKQEVLRQLWCVRKTLQAGVHKTSIAEVGEPDLAAVAPV